MGNSLERESVTGWDLSLSQSLRRGVKPQLYLASVGQKSIIPSLKHLLRLSHQNPCMDHAWITWRSRTPCYLLKPTSNQCKDGTCTIPVANQQIAWWVQPITIWHVALYSYSTPSYPTALTNGPKEMEVVAIESNCLGTFNNHQRR